MNVNEKLAVLMEFNGYTKDELEAYLSLKFGSMTKGGMTASILSQSGYEKAKSVIFGQPQLNPNQQIVLEYLKRRFSEEPDISKKSIFKAIDHLLYNFWDDNLNDAFYALDLKQESQVLQAFSQWALEQEEE